MCGLIVLLVIVRGGEVELYFLSASTSLPFATCTELGVVASCTSVKYFSALQAPKLPEDPMSKIAVACATI